MEQGDWLAQRFEQNRGHLKSVAYRMLGSATDADDAVQEAWIRLSRSGADGIENLSGWLTTVVARVCLDMLRVRKSRREDSLDASGPDSSVVPKSAPDPEREALLAESVGLALLVVLETLDPAERVAFVLHDTFGVPFDEIASIVGRTADAARQLASRARRRLQGAPGGTDSNISRQRDVVDAFLGALRRGDFEGLVAVLDPDLVVRADRTAAAGGAGGAEVRGAHLWAKQAIRFARGARFAQSALVDGGVGVVVAPQGRLFRALRFTFVEGKIAVIDVVGDPDRLNALELSLLDN